MDVLLPQLLEQFPPMIAIDGVHAGHDADDAQHHVRDS